MDPKYYEYNCEQEAVCGLKGDKSDVGEEWAAKYNKIKAL